MTTAALRCMDKAGGFDNYILTTKDKWLGEGLAQKFKKELKEAYRKKHKKHFSAQVAKSNMRRELLLKKYGRYPPFPHPRLEHPERERILAQMKEYEEILKPHHQLIH